MYKWFMHALKIVYQTVRSTAWQCANKSMMLALVLVLKTSSATFRRHAKIRRTQLWMARVSVSKSLLKNLPTFCKIWTLPHRRVVKQSTKSEKALSARWLFMNRICCSRVRGILIAAISAHAWTWHAPTIQA